MKRTPTNTTKQDPLIHLMDAMFTGPSKSIELSEARGQRELVNSDVLPTKGLKTNEALITAGLIIGKPVEGDDLFTYVTLPAGWKKEGSNHSMWSYLIDEKGRRRAAMFYKAAFYDRGAHITAERRYSIRNILGWETDNRQNAVVDNTLFTQDSDGVAPKESILFSGKVHKVTDYGHRDDDLMAWLKENKPNWEDPAAYWDE